MITKKFYLLLGSVILVLTTLSYIQTFQAEFQFDDKDFIVENYKIRDITDIKSIWQSRPIPSSRFIPFLTFALNYHFSKLDVLGYHLTNFVIHLLTVALVWWLSSKIVLMQASSLVCSTDKAGRKKNDAPASWLENDRVFIWLIPFSTAIIYALHPIQTQAITYISQRMASLATMFYLLSVCFYIALRQPGTSSRKVILLYLGSFIAAIMAMFSKEIAITLPLMILFVEGFVLPRVYGDKLRGRKHVIALLLLIYLLLTVIILYFYGFKVVTMLFSERISESHHGDILTLPRYILTQARVWMTFLRLIILPLNQNLDYDFPMSHSLLRPWTTFVSLLGLCLMIFYAIKERRHQPIVTFGLFWFFISISANLVPRRHVIFEHKMYLSSIGLCLVLSVIIFYFFRKPRQYLIATMTIALILGVLTFQRNKVWRYEVTLWEDIIKKSPAKIRVNNNLGTLYYDLKQYNRALDFFNKALEVNPGYASANNNRGAVYIEKGLLDLALKDINRAIAIDPEYASAYKNRGDIYKKKGRHQEALKMYDQALKIDPRFIDGYDVRGILYGELGKFEKALLDFNKALEMNPNHAGSLHNKGTVFMRQGKKQAALDLFNRAIKNDPHNPDTYRNRGNIHQGMGLMGPALEDYHQALQLNSDYKDAYNSRGVLYARQGEYQSAVSDFKHALRIDPSYPDAYNNMGMVFKIRKDYPSALKYLNQAIHLNPHYASAYYNRSLVYFEQGLFAEAFNDADKAKAYGYPIDKKYYHEIQTRMDK